MAKESSEPGRAIVERATEIAKQQIAQIGEVIAQGASETGKLVQSKTDEVRESISHTASEISKSVLETTVTSMESMGQKTQSWVETIHLESLDQLDLPTQTSSGSMVDWSRDELYHIFISPQLTLQGGTQMVTVKTGKSYQVKIPPNRTEGSNLQLRGCGLEGSDAFIVLHTLFHPLVNIDRRVNHLITHAPIYDQTKIRCIEAYNRVNEALPVDDFAALELLDYLIYASKLYAEIGQRYTIASQNSWLLGLENTLESALAASQLSRSEKQLLRATYQYLKAGEAVPSLEVLAQLDTIILNAALKPTLKQYYWVATATSWVATVDLILLYGLHHHATESNSTPTQLLDTYLKLRDQPGGLTDSSLQALDQWIAEASIPNSCRIFYRLVRELEPDFDKAFCKTQLDDQADCFEQIQSVVQAVQSAATVPQPLELPPIHHLNFMAGSLTEKFYSAVCRGGLGLLGKSTLPPVGCPWVNLSMAFVASQVAQMPAKTKANLGIADASQESRTKAIGTNFQLIHSPDVAKTSEPNNQSGLLTYQVLMAELGEAIRLPEAFSSGGDRHSNHVWKLLTRGQDKQRIVKDLEAQMYRNLYSS